MVQLTCRASGYVYESHHDVNRQESDMAKASIPTKANKPAAKKRTPMKASSVAPKAKAAAPKAAVPAVAKPTGKVGSSTNPLPLSKTRRHLFELAARALKDGTPLYTRTRGSEAIVLVAARTFDALAPKAVAAKG
jgi:sRNA-binding protein